MLPTKVMRWAALCCAVEFGLASDICEPGSAGGALVQTSSAHIQRAVAAEGVDVSTARAPDKPSGAKASSKAPAAMALEQYSQTFSQAAASIAEFGRTLQKDFADAGLGAPGNVFVMIFVVLLAVGVALLIILSLEDKTLDQDMKASLASGPPTRGKRTGQAQRAISETGQSVASIPASSAASSLVPPWPNIPHFCPELVVPTGHEAVLAVPLSQTELQIKDLDGNPVIKAEVWPDASGLEPIVQLTALQGLPLAQCRLTRSAGQSVVEVINARNERYASILRVTSPGLLQTLPSGQSFGKAYMLAPGGDTSSGMYLLFGGNFAGHNVVVVNERKEALAETEPVSVPFDKRNRYFKMTVTSNGDVGLMLCALLSISVLERS